MYQPRVFTLNNDGTVRKVHELDIQHPTQKYSATLSPRDDCRQKIDLALSPKHFGNRRNVVYTNAGLSDYYSITGFQTVDSSGTEDSVSMTTPQEETPQWYWQERHMWGNAGMTINGMESQDVFVLAHTSHLSQTGNIYLYFLGVDRNESGTVSSHRIDVQGGDQVLGHKLLEYSNGIRAVDITAGDFDKDGWKNEIAVCYNDNNRVYAFFFRASKVDDHTVKVEHIRTEQLLDQHYRASDAMHQASVTALTGDFDGDGQQEAAFVYRYPHHQDFVVDYIVSIVKYDRENGRWKREDTGSQYNKYAASKATVADLDGDGKDEIVILHFPEGNNWGETWPYLQCWRCDSGIKPVGFYTKGGINNSVLGYAVGVSNSYYLPTEEFSITAGPVTGTPGKAKLAEDIIISHVNSDASRVFVFPTQLNGNQFAGIGNAKKIYEYTGSDSSRRGAVITGDFANEVLMLGTPSHKIDDHDESYVAVLQTFPYHVDNVDIDGNRTDGPINYTFSGFTGSEGNGEMNVAYSKEDTSISEQDVSFGMASTTETIGLLGEAGKFAAGGLRFATTAANIAGNFDPRVKTAAGIMDGIMGLFLDRIDETTTKATKEANYTQSVTSVRTDMYDAIYKYTAPQHIWRYKILNKPLPSWYKFGPKADDSNGDVKTESRDYYLTFTLYDNVGKAIEPSNQTNTYEAFHEEGNFFSYPSDVKLSEGYNASGLLDESDNNSVKWSKGLQLHATLTFKKETVDKLKYDENIQRSELTKTVSAIASFFGLDDPDPFPPYTSHNETFMKSFSTSERIDFNLVGRSTERGEYAGHTLYFVPYLAREGTMKVAMAVKLTQDGTAPLWEEDSLYNKLPDPALLLPGKYIRNGGRLMTNNIASSAMKLRGLRFYVPELDLHSDRNFLAGLTYKVRVPLYNASFLDTGNFDVRLSYARAGKGAGKFNVTKPYITSELQEIQTLQNVTMGGWQNAHSDNNKKWLEFTFDVPENASTDNYVFYVQIDPEHKLEEVHESRMDSAGKILDSGGNNEGYYSFHITSMQEAQQLAAKRSVKASSAAPRALSSRGTIYRAVSKNPSGNSEGEVFSSEAGLDLISIMSIFEGTEGLDLLGLLAVFGEGYSNGEKDADALIKADDDETYPIVMDITYNGDEYYPEAYLCGFNYKNGTLDENGSGEVDHSYMDYMISLVPHTTTTVVINLDKQYMDYINGTGFEIVVPALSGSGSNPEPEPAPEPEPEPEPESDNIIGSSGGGGCDSGFTALSLGILISALILRKKSQ